MKILFIGCVKSSYLLLKELIENKKQICGVITKRNNYYNSDFEDLTPLCHKHGIEINYTEDINDVITISYIKKLNPDVIYCFGWSQLLKNEIISCPILGVVGFHPAKLPFNKGRHPLIWALVLGLQETASTFFMIDEKADNGPIISQSNIKISYEDDASILYEKVMEEAQKQVLDFTNKFENNSVEYINQDSAAGNIWRKRGKDDGRIDFRMSANNIYNLVRGLTKPYIGAHFEYKGEEYKVWRCEVVENYDELYDNIEFGKVLEVYSPNSFLVRVGDFLIRITDCDKNDLKAGDYL